MRIDEITLVGYKRMQLGGTRSIHIKMSEVVQLILGSNGSGKSSLLSELTPLPANSADFLKDGSKTILITHRGNKYRLVSKFTSGTGKHSFLKNDEELNAGGTISVQRELVLQEFNITPAIHQMLIGDEVFHNMSPSKRREWFTMLSDTNYDYALAFYERARVRVRDTEGVLKHAKKRLAIESAKVISLEEETKLRQDVDATVKELNFLIVQSAPLDKPVSSYREEQIAGLEELNRLCNRLQRTVIAKPSNTNFGSIEDIGVAIDGIKQQVAGREALLIKAVSEHTKIDETVKTLMKTGEEGAAALRKRINTMRDEKQVILDKRKLKIEGVTGPNALSALDSVYDVLTTIFTNISENSDKRFNSGYLKELNDQLLVIKDKKLATVKNYEKHTAIYNQMEAHKKNGLSTCPKCNYSWTPGYSDEQHEKIAKAINALTGDIETINKEIALAEETIVAVQEYGKLRIDFNRCVSNWPILKPFWEYLIDGEYVTNSPRKVLTLLELFKFDLQQEALAAKVDDQITEVFELIKMAETVGDANLQDMKTKLSESTIVIEELTFELTKLRNMQNEHVQYKTQLQQTIKLGDDITNLMDHTKAVTKDMIEMKRREAMNHCVTMLQSSLAVKQKALSEINLQKAMILDLEQQIEKQTIEHEAGKLIVACVSPVDGLIAEGLLGFIQNFITQMNVLIKKIWTYPLQIMDCAVDDYDTSELTYRFPFKVENNIDPVPDIKFGSEGMQDVIDLAFKVTAMKHLGLSESPLILDEPGSSFDVKHKSLLGDFVKNLMNSQPFSQVYIVSHDYAQYGSFTNTEVCVLDSRNITVPARYNTHVNML